MERAGASREGTYVLEVRATWEPVADHDGPRLARLIRRRRPGAVANSAVRRLAFTVVDAEARVPAISLGGSAREIEVDSVDLSRARSRRPVATGRSPAAGPTRLEWGVPTEALIEPSRRDRVRGWFTRNGGEAAKLDAADAGGFAWTALGLKVMHPDRPHRLRLQIKRGRAVRTRGCRGGTERRWRWRGFGPTFAARCLCVWAADPARRAPRRLRLGGVSAVGRDGAHHGQPEPRSRGARRRHHSHRAR